MDTNGALHFPCDVRPNQYGEVESSTNLVDWIYAGGVYRDSSQPSALFSDPDAWKYPRRFYRFTPDRSAAE